MFDCKSCGNEVCRSYGKDKIKIRTNIIIIENGKTIVKCLKCKHEVEIPLFLKLPTGEIVPKNEKNKGKKAT